jgi:hypothetical protein
LLGRLTNILEFSSEKNIGGTGVRVCNKGNQAYIAGGDTEILIVVHPHTRVYCGNYLNHEFL